MITNNARCTCGIQYRIAMAKAALNRKKNLFTTKLDLSLRKKLVKCCAGSTSLNGAETWTIRNADQKYLENFKMW
jgi:predicted adenine nucleotide alpha hydrolase (AANH) superfamily ATPase